MLPTWIGNVITSGKPTSDGNGHSENANFERSCVGTTTARLRSAPSGSSSNHVSMVFSFEKMALRDATKVAHGAKAFAEGLHDFLYGSRSLESRFIQWVEVVSGLPRKQTRVLTWPLVTVFGFIAQPDIHIFLKPLVTRAAARALRLRFSVRLASQLEYLHQSAGIRRARMARPAKAQTSRHDRRAVIHLGSGIGRI